MGPWLGCHPRQDASPGRHSMCPSSIASTSSSGRCHMARPLRGTDEDCQAEARLLLTLVMSEDHTHARSLLSLRRASGGGHDRLDKEMCAAGPTILGNSVLAPQTGLSEGRARSPSTTSGATGRAGVPASIEAKLDSESCRPERNWCHNHTVLACWSSSCDADQVADWNKQH